jgi:photosystem II stability/assembly factor-like uncharacterized protein
MPDLIGKTIGQYRIVEQIGLGGMATVFKAYQPSMDRYVALKVLSTHLAQDTNFIKRFQQEAKIIAKLEHLHILPVYDHGEQEGYLYLVMRFIEAGTLKDRLKQGPLSLGEAHRVVQQVGSALEYAHQLGVIHRDMKPSNILIDPQGDCYLTDFGIAKMVEGTLGLTGSGIVGTPHYMAPEQSRSHTVDHRADIYAMGIVIYEMVTGQLPYDAETPFAVVMKHMTEPLPLPRTIRPDLPEAVERVILRALAKDPADRYQSMRDLVAAFDQAVQAAPDQALAPRVNAARELAAAPAMKPTVLTSRRVSLRRWFASQPTWLLPAAGLALIVLIVAGVILSRIPGRVEIAGGQLQLVTPTAMVTSITLRAATPTSEAAVVVPTYTPAPASTPPATATLMPAHPPASVVALKWERLAGAADLMPVTINALSVDPNDPNTIFAGTYGAGIYASRDGGKTWMPSSDGLGKGTVGQIVVHPKNSSVVYAALFDQGGIYKSTDGGRTWQMINTGINLDQAWNWTGLIYLDPSNPDRLYFSDTTSGLYLSTDAGARWNQQSRECPPVTNLAIDPANGDHLYAASYEHPDSTCHAGVYESTDAGLTWKRLTTDTMVAPADRWGGDWWHLAVSPRDFKIIYAGGQAGTYKSSDGGKTWTKIAGYCQWLATHPDSGAVYCGQGGQVRISRDGGATWSSSGFGASGGGQESFPFAIVPGTQILYAGGNEVVRSSDGGQSWKSLGWLSAARARLVIDPRDSNRLFLSNVDNPGRVYRSIDGGKTWRVALDNVAPGGRVTIDPAQGVVYYPNPAGYGATLYRSKNNSQTWEEFGKGQPTHGPWQLLPDPQDSKKLWLVGECGTRLAVSEDNGKTFVEVKSFSDNVCQPIMLIDISGQRLYIVAWGSFYRSDDGGNTWQSVGNVSGIYRSAALDPSDPNVVYLGSTHKGLLKSTNGGQNWSQLSGLPAASINDLAIDPRHPQTVYAATDAGAFITLDGGEQWIHIQDGLGPNPIAYSIAADPNDSSKVYVVTPDGIFRLIGAA